MVEGQEGWQGVATEHVNGGESPGDDQRRFGYLAEDVRRRLGPGARLSDDARQAFEGRLGGDLSGVMVHRGPLAGHLARSLGADALSAGDHVLGGEDTLDESTATGAGLLAHELSHVVQRDSSEAGEHVARVVEAAVGGGPGAAQTATGAAPIDVDALVERVYRRMVDELRRDNDRAAWMV
jgi:hypothetical protein